MARDAKDDHAPQDLPVTETMQIAALLAELMPPGGISSNAGPGPLSILADELPGPTASEIREGTAPIVPAPIQAVPPPLPEAKPAVAPHSITATPAMTPNRPARRITANIIAASAQTVTPAAGVKPEPRVEKKVEPPKPKIEPRVPAAKPQPEPKVDVSKPQPAAKAEPRVEAPKPQPAPKVEAPKPKPQPSAVPAPVTVPASEIFKLHGRKTEPVPVKQAPAEATKPVAPEPAQPLQTAVPADDLIPLGDLSLSGYLSLVNWRNDKEQAKHPRRSDYGLDEQTLALARRNPFYVVGKPRRPEARNVASVLSEIAWE